MILSEKYASAHEHPEGAGDARPSAMQIIKDEGLQGRMNGLVVLITGGNSGLGLETAKAMHATGAEVVMPVRSQAKGDEAVQQIEEANKGIQGAGSLKLMHIDMSSLKSVRKFAGEFKEHYKQLNILINNAGIMACPHSHTEEGFETQFGVNHLAHFLLFCELKSLLLDSSRPAFHSRVVCLSSLGHRRSTVKFDDLDFQEEEYQPFVAYGQSKTANIWMATEIERRYGAQGLHAWAVHPGGIMTNLGRHLDPAFFETFQQDEAIMRTFKDAPQGAATTVWAAVGAELEGKGGAYCEDCHVANPAPQKQDLSLADPGYAEHAYDEAGAQKLWEESLKMVGMGAQG